MKCIRGFRSHAIAMGVGLADGGCVCVRSWTIGRLCANCVPGVHNRCLNRVQQNSTDRDVTQVEDDTSDTSVNEWIDIYDTVAKWRPNLFTPPTGTLGKRFVDSLSTILSKFRENNVDESTCLTESFVFCQLLLQKPTAKCKRQLITEVLGRRLNQWEQGNIRSLVCEGTTLQNRLPKHNYQNKLHRKVCV